MNLQQNLTISFAISSPDFDLIFTLLSSYRHHIFIIYIYILALFPSYVDKIITISSPDFHYVLTPYLHQVFTGFHHPCFNVIISSLYLHQMLTIPFPHLHHIFARFSPYFQQIFMVSSYHQLFITSSPNSHHIFIIYIFSISSSYCHHIVTISSPSPHQIFTRISSYFSPSLRQASTI